MVIWIVVRVAMALSVLLSAEALAGGKKEGAGESGGGATSPIASTASGPREKTIAPEQAGESLGDVSLAASMLAGAGAGKCRMNFVLFNNSSATIALGMVGTSVSSKGDILDNWVINIGALAPGGQTARLFSCAIGAAQLSFSPLADFGTPPIKCLNAKQEVESCAVGMKIRSTLPMIEKDQIKPPEPAGGKKH
ncbi:hypothetical protein [Paramagnetospirillum marisnigri]|uniref:hypothetical protein n=1 Tax=Paramagnetospirillum marisnigri TaxID=1285242 RepID=UPI000837CC9E|nr:hypothetical protein [Paramagnetospirillum marisnigri]